MKFIRIVVYLYIVILGNHHLHAEGNLLLEQDTPLLSSVNYLTGRYKPMDYPHSFALVPKKYTMGSRKIYLHRAALQSFLQMQLAAQADGIELKIISGFRSYRHQMQIWSHKYRVKYRKKYPNPAKRVKSILEYSALPGTSRHHWGSEIDLNTLQNSYFDTPSGKKVQQWLNANAHNFGYYLVYTNNRKKNQGHHIEKWHYTYLPLSNICYRFYQQKVKAGDVNRFPGSEHVNVDNIMAEYVNAIDNKLLL